MIKYKFNKILLRQIALFLMVGGVCYVVGMVFLIFFVEILKIEVNLANLIASLLTIFICYYLNVKLVFKSGRYSRKKEFFTFFSFSIFGLILNVVLMYLMTTYLPIWYVISKTLITIFIAVFNFIVRKKLVFLN